MDLEACHQELHWKLWLSLYQAILGLQISASAFKMSAHVCVIHKP